jgi:hypothetical protein
VDLQQRRQVIRKPGSSNLVARLSAVVVVLLAVFAAIVRADDSMPVMPLADVKPGMKGEWHTVVSGTRIDRFPMEVVGIAENFIGPQRAVIICRGLDSTNIDTGPVAGMSGSPVFIDGKLIGAYAYGFLLPKDQDLFGVTPIESMLEVENGYGPPSGADSAHSASASDAAPGPRWAVAPAAVAAAALPAPAALQSAMKPLPTPLFVSGVSERTLGRFASRLSALGLEVMQAPSGSSTHSFDNDLKPGSAVSGVLLSGDFDFAGTGTVTWRHGNRILAFGHPFLQSGPSQMPMASAEILTVVQSYLESFKLPVIGPVVGSIYQDRLTAIAGEIGRTVPTTHLETRVDSPGGHSRVFQGELFQNQKLSSILTAISLLESLNATMEAETEQTIYMDTTITVDGHDPVQLSDAAGAADGAFAIAINQLMLYDSLLANPVEVPNVKSLVFHARLARGWKSSTLESLDMDEDAVKPGASLHAVIGLRNYRGASSTISVTVPVPADLRTTQLELFVGDADAAAEMDDPPRVPPQTLDQVLDRLRLRRSHQNICVKLLQDAQGVSVEGENLPDLPPSVAAQFNSPNGVSERATLSRITLWETNFPAEGSFSGRVELPVRIK